MSAILIASSRLCAQIGLAIFLQSGFIHLPMNGSAAAPEAAAAGSFSSCSWACGIRFCVVIGHSYVCYSIMPFGQFDSDPNFQSVCSP